MRCNGCIGDSSCACVLLTDNDEYFEKATLFGDMMRVMEIPGPARRFAATTFGVKTRMAPMSAAIARAQLKHLDKRNAVRNQNIRGLSERLERLGIDTFLGPSHVKRVYFEFLVRNEPSRTGIETDLLIEALQAEGCLATCPRYPLLHQQPFFTEGHFASISRVGHDGQGAPIAFDSTDLPGTVAENEKMVKLPSFPSANEELLDSYAAAFEKILSHADEIRQFERRRAVTG